MARLLLSKATLSKQRQQLQSYQRFLPSLDMKRQQLRLALKNTEKTGQALQHQLDQLKQVTADELPMIANERVNLQQLLSIESINVNEINVAGCRIPEFQSLQLALAPLPPLAKPHWVAPVQNRLAQALEIEVKLTINAQQQALLSKALTKITQRVNLFDKVLIPQTQANIKRIQIYLGDRAREAVVTSKIAKRRRQSDV